MSFHLLEPELEELLQSIASDPRSSLLKVDRPAIARGPFDQDLMVRPSATGLTAAERHLLRVHRSELAQWLRYLLFEMLYCREPNALCTDLGKNQQVERRTEEESRSTVLELNNRLPDPPVHRSLLNVVKSTHPLEYATLSCRIEPCTAGYLQLTDAYEIVRNKELERRALGLAHRLQSTQKERAHVFSYRGYAAMTDRQFGQSAALYKSACDAGGRWPNELLSLLTLSAQSTDERMLQESVETLDEHPVHDETLTQWVDDQLLLRSAGAWRPTARSFSFIRSKADGLNEQARYVLTTLFHK